MTHAKVSLKPWQPLRVWRNRTNLVQRRTITVYPCVETFPPGCEIKVFEAPDTEGLPPSNGHIEVGQRGDSVGLAVQPGNAIFVHINLSESKVASVLADITQEP
jgi:hypothetical protein